MTSSLNRMVILAISLAFVGNQHPSHGATFSFDLTDAVGSDFNTSSEPTIGGLLFPPGGATIDLGMQFSRIDSAAVEITGFFTPGVTISGISGLITPIDAVTLDVRLREEGSGWLDKGVFASQSLAGHSGAVTFTLPLKGFDPTLNPSAVPGGELAPDFSFMTDGRFDLATSARHFSLLIHFDDEQSVPPRFELTNFTLRVEGAAVPEPATGMSMATLAMAAVGAWRRRSSIARLQAP
jgi:hypothetical protein